MRTDASEQAIKRSIVQILNADGVAVGCGLLVSDRNIVTCAHVVATALATSSTRKEPPSTPVEVVFPHSMARKTWRASVAIWSACIEPRVDDTPEDIAVLALDGAPPLDVTPKAMMLCSDWSGRSYVAHGFPGSGPNGDWVGGTFQGVGKDGWVQLLPHDASDLQLDEGFSGGGVWDSDVAGFAGITVAVEDRRSDQKRVAFMIPTKQLLRAWPALPVVDPAKVKGKVGAPPGWPRPPAIVHRYTLLDAQRGLVGRRNCLSDLRHWRDDDEGETVLALHAIGGTGKSALAWTWFHEAFANNVDVRGGLWYSFYEPGASFSDFLQRLYGYIEEGDASAQLGRELGKQQFEPLFQVLKQNKLLIVLDGFERLLRAYTTEGSGSNASSNAELTEKQERQLCFAGDENVNAFLTALAQPMASRFLITSRLVPAAMLNVGGEPRSCMRVYPLDSLEPDDVVAMMSGYGVTGSSARIVSFARKFGFHALLVKLIAATVGNSMEHGRDFDAWLAGNPSFDPSSLDITENRVHVLQCALEQLGPTEQRVLLHVAALRGAVRYSDLVELLQPALQRAALEGALKTLHQLTLIEWDHSPGRNHFDLHPLVRNTVWLRASSSERTSVDERLVSEFQAYPLRDATLGVDDEERALSVFGAFIRLGRMDEAWTFAGGRFLSERNWHTDISLLLELTQAFMTADGWPRLSRREDRADCLLKLAKAHEVACDLEQALLFFERHRVICPSPTCMLHQAIVMRDTGQSVAACNILEKVLSYVQLMDDPRSEVAVLHILANQYCFSDEDLLRLESRFSRLFMRMSRRWRQEQRRWLLWRRQSAARRLASRGDIRARRKLVALERLEVRLWEQSGNALHLPSALRRLAEAEANHGDLQQARATAQRAIELSRRLGRADTVATGHIALASILLRLGEYADVGPLLDTALQTVVRGKLQAELCEIRELQARLALRTGDMAAAQGLAMEAHRIAWGEGPPFAYGRLLERITDLLREVGCAPPVDLPRPAVTAGAAAPFHLDSAAHPARRARRTREDLDWEKASPVEAERLLFVPSGDFPSTEVERTIERANADLTDGNVADAILWSRRATKLDPYGHDCWATLAKCSYHAGDLDQAIKQYTIAVDRSKDASLEHDLYAAERGVILALMKNKEEALRDVEPLHWYYPKYDAAMAYILATSGRFDESRSRFQRAVTEYPDDPWVHYFHGRTLDHLGERATAAEAFRLAVGLAGQEFPRWMLAEAELGAATSH